MSKIAQKEDYVLAFNQFLEKKQLRKTAERAAMLQRILAFDKHFTIEDIISHTKPAISRATAYNMLTLMLQARLLVKHHFPDTIEYELAGRPRHSHQICTTCGKIKEVRDTQLITTLNTRKYTAFNLSHLAIYLYGECSTCARRRKKLTNKPDYNES